VESVLTKNFDWSSQEVRETMLHAYQVGAVGERFRRDGVAYTNFSYRNSNAQTLLGGMLVLQTALARGLNRPGVGHGALRDDTGSIPLDLRRSRARPRRPRSGP